MRWRGPYSASPLRIRQLPGFPGAARRPPRPGTRANHRFPGCSRVPGLPPDGARFPTVKVFLHAAASVTQEPTGIHFEFFRRPHVAHRTRAVIRTSLRLSTGLCTKHPQVTWRSSGNTGAGSRVESFGLFPGDGLLQSLKAGAWRQAVRGPPWRQHAAARRGRGNVHTLGGRLPHPPPSAAVRRPAAGGPEARPSGRRPGAAGARPGSQCAGKYNCPLQGDDLPWIYDDMAGAETSRVHEPDLAARGCPDRWSGGRVSAKRHLPATAPGKASRGGFRLPRDEPADRQPVPKTGKMRVQLLPSLRASRTGLVFDTSIA